VRQRSTIDRDKRLAVTRAAIANGLGEHFLANAAFAAQQQVGGAARGLSRGIHGA
jgi:hypothetical protein